MAAKLFLGKISSIDTTESVADVVLQDREDSVIVNVPVLIPIENYSVGDTVFTIINEDGHKFGRSVILGVPQ